MKINSFTLSFSKTIAYQHGKALAKIINLLIIFVIKLIGFIFVRKLIGLRFLRNMNKT